MKTKAKNKTKKSVKDGGGFRGIKRFSKTPRKSNLWCVKTGSTLEDDILEYMAAHHYKGQTLDQLKTKIKNSNDFRSWFNLCNNGVIKTDEEIQKIIEHEYNEARAANQDFDAELAADLKKETYLASEEQRAEQHLSSADTEAHKPLKGWTQFNRNNYPTVYNENDF
jgi:hypothetical protein